MTISTASACRQRIGVASVLLALCQCSKPLGPSDSRLERKPIVRAALAAERAGWPSPNPTPCVQPSLRQTGDIQGMSGPVATVSQNWLPPPFLLCGTSAKGRFLWLADPQVRGQEAFVEVDFHCGGMCGVGKTYSLERSSKGWKVTGASVTWQS